MEKMVSKSKFKPQALEYFREIERTGKELARTEPLAPAPAPGNIVTPGFGGRFYYLSQAGALWELRPRAS